MSAPTWKDVISFWFGEIQQDGLSTDETKKRWWSKDSGFDAEVGDRFGELHQRIAKGEHAEWMEAAPSAVAGVIVLDQFSRNMFRDTAQMFATDARARELAKDAIGRGFDREVPACMRAFLYMPLMHSEELDDQERCVELFASAAASAEGDAKKAFENYHNYAVMHRDIVARFGRFPHRNKLVDRETSEEETAFLEGPGSSF